MEDEDEGKGTDPHNPVRSVNDGIRNVRSVSINPSGCHIAFAEQHGFRVVSAFERREVISRPKVGALTRISQMATSNLFVLATSHGCLLFDDSRQRIIGELGPFEDRVVGLQWAGDMIAVQLLDRVLVYDVKANLHLAFSDACASTAGLDTPTLAAVSTRGVTKIAYPGPERGTIVVVDMGLDRDTPEGEREGEPHHTETPNRVVIKAHKHDIAAVCLSPDGLKLATASTKGTVLRIFKATNADEPLAFELRRSSTKARIHAMAFSFDESPSLFACTSDSGTLHVFTLTGTATTSPRSLPTLLQRSQWRYELPDKTPCAISFHSRSPKPLLTAVSQSGSWHIALLLEKNVVTCLESH